MMHAVTMNKWVFFRICVLFFARAICWVLDDTSRVTTYSVAGFNIERGSVIIIPLLAN